MAPARSRILYMIDTRGSPMLFLQRSAQHKESFWMHGSAGAMPAESLKRKSKQCLGAGAGI